MSATKEQLPAQNRVHHPYSPSSLQSREACPKYLPRNNETRASLEGTMQHDVAETGEDNHRLADFKAIAAVQCMQFVEERFRLYPGGQLLKEQYLPIDDELIRVQVGTLDVLADPNDPESEIIQEPLFVTFEGTTAGYVDTAIISADQTVAEITDYKFGQWGVEDAATNLQGISYLLGLKKKFPKLKKGFVWFFLPHRDELKGAEFDLTQVGNQLYLRVCAVVARAIEANKDPSDFSMANPTTSACMFCGHLGRCPKVAEVALEIGKKYRPLVVPPSISTTVFTDPKDTGRGLEVASVIKAWAEAFRQQATAKTIDAADFIPEGYEVVEMSKRTVKNARKLIDFAKRFIPPTEADKMDALFDVSIGPIEDLISAAAPRGQKDKTVKEFGAQALEAGFVEMGSPFAFLRQEKKAKATTKQ